MVCHSQLHLEKGLTLSWMISWTLVFLIIITVSNNKLFSLIIKKNDSDVNVYSGNLP